MTDHLETELLAKAKAGSREAFEEVLLPHVPMLFAYSRAICGDYHAAQDVVQETSLIAFGNLHHLFPEADFATWVKAIARREALYARRKMAKANPVAEQVLEGEYHDPTPAAVSDRREALSKCLKSLGGRAAGVLEAHYFGGSNLPTLAQMFDTTQHAASQLLYRARLALRECIQRRLRQETPA